MRHSRLLVDAGADDEASSRLGGWESDEDGLQSGGSMLTAVPEAPARLARLRQMSERALAPRCFADLLEVPVPGELRTPGIPARLRDLDGAACRGLGPRVVTALRDAVIGRLRFVGSAVVQRPLPGLPDGVRIQDLDLTVRASNVLQNATWSGKQLAELTFRDLLRAKNCGWKSVHEIAIVFEAARTPIDAPFLEDELADLLNGASRRGRAIALHQLGWDGQGGASLGSVAREEGLTRERVRQIVMRAVHRLNFREPPVPRLHDAMRVAAAAAPAPAKTVARKLAAAGVSRSSFDPLGLLTAAQLLRLDPPIALKRIGSEPIVLPAAIATLVVPIVKAAEHVVRRDGIGRVAEVVTRCRIPVDVDTVRIAISSRSDARWLGEGRDWFFIGLEADSPLCRHARKAFAGSDRISGRALRESLARSRHLAFARAVVPPLDILLHLFRGIDGFQVRDGSIHASGPSDPAESLTKVDRAFLRVFRTYGPLLAHIDIERLMHRAGFRLRNVGVYLPRLPFIAKYGPGIYGLIDERVARDFHDVSSDGGGSREARGADGAGVRVSCEVTASIASTGAIRLPPELGKLPYRGGVQDEAGEVVGRVVAEAGLALGLRSWLERSGAAVGQRLRLWRDTRSGPLRIAVGEEPEVTRPVVDESRTRSQPTRPADFSKISHADLVAAIRTLVTDGRISAQDVRAAAVRAGRIAALEAELAALRGNGTPRARSLPGPGKSSVRAKRKITDTPKRRAALKLQGAYLGRLRKLPAKEKLRVRAVAKAEGVSAALELADRILAG